MLGEWEIFREGKPLKEFQKASPLREKGVRRA
jgi:hypothetical protein